MNNKVVDLMHRIATEAMNLGKDISLEQKEYFHDSKGIGPSIGGGHTEDTGVILRVWQPADQKEEGESND